MFLKWVLTIGPLYRAMDPGQLQQTEKETVGASGGRRLLVRESGIC